ncbi:MAG: endonuclease Q family protein [Candidatus Pacearchaeota archaeon]|nr:endonuclease Q family protein [Candidatus Pacearchaeota archaeon]
MEIIADLHIHSKYSRATSKNLDLENIEKYARIKGLNLLGVGDFQHPLWKKEIDNKLREDGKGILWSKRGFPFLWQTEISLMFSKNGRRAVHVVVLVPNGKIANEFIKYLGNSGRLDYDGRPIFGISAEKFVEDVKKIDDGIEIIPAHCMTPWFGLYGSDSGFDSLEECFGKERDKIYAVESGMSADPSMLWRLKEKINIVSFSDSHSFWPWRLGREATIFELSELSYWKIINAIRTGQGLKGTIETPPEYGKYHFDGHRLCGFSCSPEETKNLKGICPKCGKPLTIGVEYRIEELAKEREGYKLESGKLFYKLIPLHELIAFAFDINLTTKKTNSIYMGLIEKFGNEFNVLLRVNKEEMIKAGVDDKLIEMILLNREGKIKVKPGYDGEYGVIEDVEKVEINNHGKREGIIEKQKKLFE